MDIVNITPICLMHEDVKKMVLVRHNSDLILYDDIVKAGTELNDF